MNFVYNVHSVPITDLFTLGTIIIILIAYVANQYYNMDIKTCIELLVVLLIIDIVIHPLVGIPNNISRYFGLGERPIGWRGV